MKNIRQERTRKTVSIWHNLQRISFQWDTRQETAYDALIYWKLCVRWRNLQRIIFQWDTRQETAYDALIYWK